MKNLDMRGKCAKRNYKRESNKIALHSFYIIPSYLFS